MRLDVVLSALLGSASLIGTAAAQPPPDFSGTWTAIKDAPRDVPSAPSAVLGPQFALRHAGQSLTISRQVRDQTIVSAYSLDGAPVRTRIPGRLCMGDTASVETAAWEGNAIAYTTVGSVPPGGGAMTALSLKRLLRLDAPGTLIVEASIRDSAQAAPRTVATVYKRTGEAPPGSASPLAGAAARATMNDAAWLSGLWIGAMGASTTEERWTPPAGGSMIALSRTLRNDVLTAFEFLCITERDGGLVYTAMPNGRTPPTDFRLTRLTPDSLTFENPAHDFPKMIRYARRPDGSLEATISGEGGARPQTFVLRKQ